MENSQLQVPAVSRNPCTGRSHQHIEHLRIAKHSIYFQLVYKTNMYMYTKIIEANLQ